MRRLKTLTLFLNEVQELVSESVISIFSTRILRIARIRADFFVRAYHFNPWLSVLKIHVILNLFQNL